MNPEDETFLSAFLDGELSPDQRASVESALVSNPVLAEHLRELTAVRDLVANLPRPVPGVDLAASVVDQIRQGPQRAARARRRVLARGMAGLAAAASIVLAVSLALSSLPRAPRPAGGRVLPAAPSVVVARSVETSRPPDGPPAAAGRTPGESSASTRRAGRFAPVLAEQEENERRRDREQRALRERLLDSPDLTHVFIVLDVIGGHAGDRVNELVRSAPRLDPAYGQITVSQGIVIDPKHPNKATVFALVLDDREMKQLRDKLNAEFPHAVQEEPADPSMVTRLSGLGDVAILSGTRATELLNPADVPVRPGALALTEAKAKHVPVRTVPNDEFPGLPVREADPAPPASENPRDAATEPERELSAPPAPPRSPSVPAAPAAVAKAEPTAPDLSHPRLREGLALRKTSVVLVWVTTPSGGPPPRR